MRHTLMNALALVLTAVVSLVVASAAGADGLAAQMVEDADATHWGYTPLHATITAGQSLTWTNVGQIPHTATDDGGAWDTGLVGPTANATLTFPTPGTYAYHCTLHDWMKGTLVVVVVVVPEQAALSDMPSSDDAPPVAPD